MKKYDVVVIGAGDVGLGVAFKASYSGLKTALIDKGNVGGTCVNTGCVPSKTLIHVADRIMEIRGTAQLGIHAEARGMEFSKIMERMRRVVASGRNGIRAAIKGAENIDFYHSECHFLNGHTLRSGNEKIQGKKIFIASGSRPAIPPIKGLDTVQYLTNETVLDLHHRPKSMIIIGGGYVGLEYAHFFSAIGTNVTILDNRTRILPFEESEISDLLKNEMSKRMEMHLGVEVRQVRKEGKGYSVLVKDMACGKEKEIKGEQVMVAAGRKSNADTLKVDRAGLETDEKGFIRTDDYLRTNKRHIWAVGDAIGKAMFTHAGDMMAEIAWHNATERKKRRMDFGAVPHAVFVFPQIASVGMTEEQARKSRQVLVGKAMYSDTVMGETMAEEKGFGKAVVEKDTNRILGFHIIGPHAAILIQEVVNAVAKKADVQSVTGAMHIFPALSGLITEVFDNLE